MHSDGLPCSQLLVPNLSEISSLYPENNNLLINIVIIFSDTQ